MGAVYAKVTSYDDIAWRRIRLACTKAETMPQ